MNALWPKIVVVVDILIYLGFGIAFLVAPAELLGEMDIALGSDASFAEVRAFYGGTQFGIGVFMAGHFRGWVSQRQVLALGAIAIGLLGATRLVATLMMPEIHPLSLQFAIVELIGGAANVSAWWVAGRQESANG